LAVISYVLIVLRVDLIVWSQWPEIWAGSIHSFVRSGMLGILADNSQTKTAYVHTDIYG